MKNLFTLLSFLLITGGASLKAQHINTETSKVSFEVSNMKFRTVEGTFSGMTGTANFDASDLKNSVFDICIDASTVNTENEKRDTHLKNEDFFHVDKHPQICFVSTSISKTNTGFEATGNLSMHGVTKVVTVPFTYENKTIKAKLDINRLDYKVGEDFGTFMVGNEVEIWIEARLK